MDDLRDLLSRARLAGMDLLALVISPRVRRGEISPGSFLQMHRRFEYGQIVVILLAAAVAAFALQLDGPAGPDLMSTLAQIIPVLLVARIVQHEWRVGKDAAEIKGRQPEFVDRFRGVESRATFWTFVIAEGSALAGVAYGPATFWVTAAIAGTICELLDLVIGMNTRADGTSALVRMVNGLETVAVAEFFEKGAAARQGSPAAQPVRLPGSEPDDSGDR